MVVVGAERDIQPFGQKVSLAVLYRRYERVATAVFFAEYDILVDTCLYLLVEVRVIESDQETVRPRLARDTDFPYDSFVVELVVEPSYVIYTPSSLNSVM